MSQVMSGRHRRFARAGHWLLIAALCYRASIPLGYMPALSSGPTPVMDGMRAAGWITFCPGGLWQANGRHGLLERQCFFGMAAAPVLPGAAISLPGYLPDSSESPPPSLPSPLTVAVSLRPPVRAPPQFL
ncbi:MAG: hypothetical protein KGJ55_05685 [Gammaproteobacteria bacterium]|nr:hypothetical protein [Gammaproteobacteria bacterium]